jgi:hypothetical protein
MQMKRYPDGVGGFSFYQEARRLQKEHSSADTGVGDGSEIANRCHC